MRWREAVVFPFRALLSNCKKLLRITKTPPMQVRVWDITNAKRWNMDSHAADGDRNIQKTSSVGWFSLAFIETQQNLLKSR